MTINRYQQLMDQGRNLGGEILDWKARRVLDRELQLDDGGCATILVQELRMCGIQAGDRSGLKG